MNVLVVIPARYGSTRLTGKPLLDIAGKSMVQRVWERGRAARGVDEVLVATDDRRIAGVVEGFGGRAVLTSPDHTSGTDRLAEVAKSYVANVYVNLQGDLPFAPTSMIESVIRSFDDPTVRIATLARRITDPADIYNPNVVKVVTNLAGDALYFSRAPIPYIRSKTERGLDGPPSETYYQHFGLYGYRREILLEFASWPTSRLEAFEHLEQLRALEHGCPIRVILTSDATQEVNTPEDLSNARTLAAELTEAGSAS